MTTATSELLLPGYRVDAASGAWVTLPWPDDPDEKAELVRMSLGPGIIDWAEGRGVDLNGDPVPGLTHYQTGEPWRFTPGQKRFILLWWLLDADGRFVYRRAVKRGAKGTGKDPLGGALMDAELCGPVELFDWDDRTGRPLGRRRGMPLVQVSSNSEAQSKDILRIANALWGADALEYYQIDKGDTRTVIKDTGGRLEVNTASEASSEGDPVTAGFLNETHHMRTPEARRVAAVARRNAAKSPAHIQARVLELTNAHGLGSGSVAEASMEAWQKQLGRGWKGRRDFLYDSIEAPPSTDILTPKGRMAGLRAAYSDAPWADLERLADEMTDTDLSVAESIRYYLNGLAAEEDAWVDPGSWASLSVGGDLERGDQIALFADLSKSEDATAVVACRLRDMYVSARGVWHRPPQWDVKRDGAWQVPRDEVDGLVRQHFTGYQVAWFGVDPGPAKDQGVLYWQATADGWVRDLGPKVKVRACRESPVMFDLRQSEKGGLDRLRQFTKAAEVTKEWIDVDGLDGPLRHDGDPVLTEHVRNAKNRPNQFGESLGKVSRDSTRLVDLAVAMVGAVMGARAALTSGKVRVRQGTSSTPTGRRSGGRRASGRRVHA